MSSLIGLDSTHFNYIFLYMSSRHVDRFTVPDHSNHSNLSEMMSYSRISLQAELVKMVGHFCW